MKTALIIGSSGGIGSAIANELRARRVAVTELSRRDHGFDVTSETSIVNALAGLEGPFDLVFVATGALEIDGASPEKTLRSVSANAMLDQFVLNAVGPSLVLKHAIRLIPRKRRCVFAALSARVGSIGDNRLGGWYSYRTAKAALNQMIHSASIELARSHKELICVALHPGTVATEFTRKYVDRHASVPPAVAATNLLGVLETLTPEDTGKFFDWQGKKVPW